MIFPLSFAFISWSDLFPCPPFSSPHLFPLFFPLLCLAFSSLCWGLSSSASQEGQTRFSMLLSTQVEPTLKCFFFYPSRFPSFGDECTSSDASSLSELTDNPCQCVDAHTRDGVCVCIGREVPLFGGV